MAGAGIDGRGCHLDEACDVLSTSDPKTGPAVPTWQPTACCFLARLPLIHSVFWISFFLLLPPIATNSGELDERQAVALQGKLLMCWMIYG